MDLAQHRTLVVVWGGLVVATVVAFLVGDDHAIGEGDAAVVAVLGITFTKVWLVGLHFMELRGAPRVLRGLFEGYCVVVPAALVVLSLAG